MISIATDLKEHEHELIVLNDGRGLTDQDVELIFIKKKDQVCRTYETG